MKTRMIALLLFLVLVLTACTPASVTPETEATAHPKPTEAEKLTEATEATEEVTEVPTEITEAPTESASELDLGVTDGSTYQNETLGISCDFPDGWYIYNETDLASLNNFITTVNQNEMLANAIENGQSVITFCASHPATVASVNLTVTKSTTTAGLSEDAIIDLVLPYLKDQMEQTGVLQNVTCSTAEATFCGQKHTVIKVFADSYGMQLCETIIYLTGGDYLYNLTVSATSEAEGAEILNLFKALK